MLDAVLNRANRWALDRFDPSWVDYVVSNTMTEFNRWANGFVWTYELKAQVVQVIDEAPGVKTFILRPNQHWRGMQAGQHIEVSLSINGERVRRCYSATPLPRGRLAITVKKIDGGLVSSWMHRNVLAGANLHFSAARGHFCHAGQAKVLYLCAGSGITPVHSMVNDLLAKPAAQRPDMQVIAQFRQASEVIFKDALGRWADSGVKVTTALSSLPLAQAMTAAQAPRLDLAQLKRLCPDLTERDIYLCGPTGFMTQMIEHLQTLKVDMSRVHTERFTALDADAESAQDFVAEGAEVHFPHLNACITLTAADQGKTLLQVATDHGLALESGCCQGMCGTCRLHLSEGQVSGNVLGRTVYLCTAYPASRTVVLDA